MKKTRILINSDRIKLNKRDIAKGLKIPKEMSLELAEEIGLHIGDGSMNYYSKRGVLPT